MIAEGLAALGAVKDTLGLVKLFIDAKSESDRLAAVLALQSALINVQQTTLELQGKCGELQDANQLLRRENEQLRLQPMDLDRYELFRFEETGASAYRLKQEFSAEGKEPEHFLCSNCYGERRKSILQGQRLLACPACQTKIYSKKAEPLAHSRIAGGRNSWRSL